MDHFINKKELIWGCLKILISITDVCAAQYHSGTICYELMLLALQRGFVIDSIVQASGHGKCICDSQGGLEKTVIGLIL